MTNRLRIVAPRFGPDVIGGAESIVRQVGLACAERGWDVEAWTTTALDEARWTSSLPPGESADDGVRVRRFPTARTRNPRLFHQQSRVLFRLPVPLRPEMTWIRAQGPYAPELVRSLASARDGVPTLFIPYLFYPTVCGLPAAQHPRILIPAAHDEKPLHLRSVARAVAAADALWFSTPEERELVVSAHPAAAEKPYDIGTVGIRPATTADGARFRERHHIQGPAIYYGGRTAPGKGFELLLEGFAEVRRRLPTAQLLLSGEAGEREAGDGTIALGRLGDTERWDAIAAADAVVVPSRHESLSLLALEGWSLGRPALLHGGSPVLAGQARRSGAALLFDDVRSFAGQAERLLSDATLAAQLGAAGRSYVATNYTWDDVVQRLRGLIERASR